MTTTAPDPADATASPVPPSGSPPLPAVAAGAATGPEGADESDPRCGYPKKDGSPCRNKVPEPGKVCRVHQKAALLDRILAGRRSSTTPDSE